MNSVADLGSVLQDHGDDSTKTISTSLTYEVRDSYMNYPTAQLLHRQMNGVYIHLTMGYAL